MMEWLPIGAVAVPVEASADPSSLLAVALRDGEVLADPVDNAAVSLGPIGVLAEEMGALVPREPLRVALPLGLALTHLAKELVVEVPIVGRAEEFWNDDHVIVGDGSLVARRRRSRQDTHRRSQKGSLHQAALAHGLVAGPRFEQVVLALPLEAASDRNQDASDARALRRGGRPDILPPLDPHLRTEDAKQAVGQREVDHLLGVVA
mmetsp:Transcript_72809/g.201856  ORF Transcript_72809/g.201856 Transcript_72809/m.201856 type:complete len:206 (-) Transcript_72809:654-1271(-)